VSFLAAWRLWFLLGAAALALAYVVVQRRRRTYAVRFTSPELLDLVAPRRPGWRRHAPAVVFLVALVTLVTGFARPTREVGVPRERATVVLAIDVSLSMMAEDVAPTRLEAAQQAAKQFLAELPPALNVGLVSFAGSATVLVTPTQDRAVVERAIDGLQLAASTAIGEAIFTSLDLLSRVPADDTGTIPPARIVLLSDGETTVGRPDAVAAQAASRAGVPVTTIGFGTPQGVIVYDDPATPEKEQQVIPVPVGEQNLSALAEATGGSYFEADTLQELEKVYADIGSAIGTERVPREITDWFVGAGLAVLAVGAGLSLLWFQRLP
jgi:Ca-activated chloride channel family protein